MIDCHCHLLPAVDDGAPDWDVALSMARMAHADGVEQIIATPHWTGRDGEQERVEQQLRELRRRLTDANLPLRVHLGNELILIPTVRDMLHTQRANTLAGSKYVLLETAQFQTTGYTENALHQLQSDGYRIVLAHPERLRHWQEKPDELRKFVWRGCYLQVNAGSLLGQFGKSAQQLAQLLVRMRWVSLLASDGHSDNRRPPLLRAAVRECARMIGDSEAEALVTANPQRILDNKILPYADPDKPFPSRLPWLFPWVRR